MPKITERGALKEIVKFAKREYKEKKPYAVKVLRVKDEKVFSKGGPFPAVEIRKTRLPYYIVILDYGDVYRIYSYTKGGMLILGENIDKDSPKIKEIEKWTKLEYKIE